jgi:MFS transporter, DHA1 family, inner membrane transport protein
MGRVAVFAVGTFAVGTDAFVVAGVLGDVSRSLQVSVAQAGQLVTVFALAYALLSPVLASLVPAEKRARTITIATSGLTTATALGAPLGTAVAIGLGWRGTMWFVAALGFVAAVVIAMLLPSVPNPPVASLRQRLAPVTDRRVLGILLTTLLMFTGIYIVYTYVSVIFEGATAVGAAGSSRFCCSSLASPLPPVTSSPAISPTGSDHELWWPWPAWC